MPARDKRAPQRHRKPSSQRPHHGAAEDGTLLFGRHAVNDALANPNRRIRELYASHNAAKEFAEKAAHHHIPLIVKPSAELAAQLPPGAVHQGIMARVDPLPEIELNDLRLDRPVLVLDQVTDPHNVGAILRSAAVFDASAIIMTRRNSPPLSGIVAKTACGGLEHVHVVFVGNLAQALKDLGRLGFFRIGLAEEADGDLETFDHPHPVALVLGAEDKGLRRLTRESCDALCRIATTGPLSSLNVSNAAAVALHTLAVKKASK